MQEMEVLEVLNHLVTADFMPHGFCYLWEPWLVWLNVVSDGLITVSYYCIPIILIYFIHKRRDLPFNRIFWMFGAFILACGTTHLMEVWTVWHASYALAGIIKAITAAISTATVVWLIPVLPQAIEIPDRIDLQDRNRRLEAQIAAQKRFDDPKTAAPFRHRMTGGTALAVLLMGSLGFLSWRSGNAALAESKLMAHAHTVAQALQTTVADAFETGASGTSFALSGNLALLAHYRASRSATTGDVDALHQLVRDNPSLKQRVNLLEPKIGAALDFTDEIVARRVHTHTVMKTSALLRGEILMNAVQTTAQAIEDDEFALLSQHTQKTHRAQYLTNLITIASMIVGVAFLVLSGLAVHREMDTNADMRAEITVLNAGLEQRVEQRTTELQESQDRLTGILGSAMDAIIVVDSDQCIVLFNPAAEHMFGCPAAEALGQPVARFIPERFHAAHHGHFRKFAETGVTSRTMGKLSPLWAVRANHQEFPIEATISQVEASGKKLFTVILRDITDRLQTQAAMRSNEEMLRLLLDGVKDYAVFMLDPEGLVTTWNAGATRIEEYSADEILGKPISIFYSPEQQAAGLPAQDLQEALAKGRFEVQGRRVRKDGSTFFAQVVMLPMCDPAGKLRGFSKVLHDITEGKLAEEKLAAQAHDMARQSAELLSSQEALEAQRRMLQSVLDSIGEGLVAADEQGKFIIWNPAAERILGRGAANLHRQQWSEHYGLFQDDRLSPFPPDQTPLARAIRGEISSAQMFVLNPALAGGTWIEANGSPLKDKHGIVRGGVVAFRDVTQQRHSEREIQKLNAELEYRVGERTAQLEEANKDLESFTYSVAHDLRAPLRHIAGFSGILMEQFGPALDVEAQRHLQRIQEGVRKMGQLIDELLTLARVGRQELNLQVAGLSSMVQEVLAILQPEIVGRQVEWRMGDLPFVECDPTLIKQIFQNLISNALKYSRPRSPAVIEIGRTNIEGDTVIFVRDNGVGFSMKYADKLFGIFQRLHRSEDFEGTGVGLATVQRIVKKHQGRVWAQAELDKGATFYFTLGALRRSEPNKESRRAGA
jgi:PAS domain S-box-containing protein